MAEMEELLLQAEGILYLLELEKLKVLADKLKVPKKDVVGKSRLKLVKLLSAVYEENFEKSTQQEFEALLNELKKFGELSPPPLEGDEVEETSTVPGCAEGAEGDNTRIKTTHTTQPDNLTMQTSMFRREFKIIGQIGEVGQREKLSYVSLIRQVEVGLDRGYSEGEVVNAIINSISPGLQIRSYLEGSGQISLARLRKILRSHYKEGSATDLYQELLTMSQEPKEDPVNFLIRAMDCRQKIIFACREESENDLKYSPVLVTGLFRQSVETGLLSDAIRGRIRPYLQNSNVDDEELINQMQLAVLAESERKKKFGLQNKASKVNEISIVEKNPQKQAKISENNDKILAAVEQIKCGVAALKTELAEMKTANYGKEQQKSSLSKPTCESCRKTGKTDCDHCSYCGSPDHNFRGCRNRKSGNGGRLPRRGGR
ncbi:uncharacterized protein LOC135696488 [Rhopilema esculentum]|uniref:uncharacterized protein LOC135696488 n=1 Tax=Rhopilema esculentum TaxID=499914 RepID=UPI0031CFAE5F